MASDSRLGVARRSSRAAAPCELYTVPEAFQITGGRISKPQILVSSGDNWGVIRAAGDLAKDFGRVTGTNFTLSNGEKRAKPATYEYRPVAANYTHVSHNYI